MAKAISDKYVPAYVTDSQSLVTFELSGPIKPPIMPPASTNEIARALSLPVTASAAANR